jgi:hypothetical protein
MVDIEFALATIIALTPFCYLVAYLLDSLIDVFKNPQERDNLGERSR